jgi:hypothetical protein
MFHWKTRLMGRCETFNRPLGVVSVYREGATAHNTVFVYKEGEGVITTSFLYPIPALTPSLPTPHQKYGHEITSRCPSTIDGVNIVKLRKCTLLIICTVL